MKGRKPDAGNVVPMKGNAVGSVPEPPELMSDAGKEVWRRLAGTLVVRGRLEPHFEDMFAVYCEAVADFIDLTSVITMDGRTYHVKTRNGEQQKKTAAWQARADAAQLMQRVGSLFGMSPVDDKRLAGGGGGTQKDLLDALMAELKGDV